MPSIPPFFHDSAGGACTFAGAAIDASVSVDDVLIIALSDSGNGAGVSAGAAGNTSVRNCMSHDKFLLMY